MSRELSTHDELALPEEKLTRHSDPHDVMCYNTDVPVQNVQDNPKTLIPIAREPSMSFYQKQWDIRLPRAATSPLTRRGVHQPTKNIGWPALQCRELASRPRTNVS
jgi:hypothetical protein